MDLPNPMDLQIRTSKSYGHFHHIEDRTKTLHFIEKQKAQQLFLDQLNQDKKKLMEFIRMKTQERDSKRQIVAYDWAEDLIKCPEEILNQLHQNIANSTNPITFFNSTY